MKKVIQLVNTIGPASDSTDMIEQLYMAGMNIARVNLSHGGIEKARQTLITLNNVRSEKSLDFKIMLDTKGPEVRIGTFKNGSAIIESGSTFTLTTKQVNGDERMVHVDLVTLPRVVRIGQELLLNDGMVRMVVDSVTDTDVICHVNIGGVLSNNKALFVPGCALELVFLSEVDKNGINMGLEIGVDMVAASFVGRAQDVFDMKDFVHDIIGKNIPIISKVESVQGIENIDEIISASEGIMIARGDLGVEYPIERVPYLQKMILEKTNKTGKFSITATEMIESMIDKPRPTRAEVADITLAVWQGTDAVMTSAETAVGKHPIRVVEHMKKITEEAANGI